METDHSADHNSQMITPSTTTARGVVSESVPPNTRDAKDFGILSDNKWDLVAAHERRFCFDHGEDDFFRMALGWPFRVGRCSLTRDTRGVLMKAAEPDGGWAELKLEAGDEWSVVPNVVGCFVERGWLLTVFELTF